MTLIKGVGKAQDIWWPEVGKKDGAEIVDVYAVINHTASELLEAAAKEKVQALLNPRQHATAPTPRGESGASGGSATATRYDDVPTPTWEQILGMDVQELVVVGVAHGGDGESLELTGSANIAALRRSVAKLCNVSMRPVAPTQQPVSGSDPDSEQLPF